MHINLFSSSTYKVLVVVTLLGVSSTAVAMGDQWYFGISAGTSRLQPHSEDDSIDIEDKTGTAASVFLGLDFDKRSSGQIELYSLGEASYDDGESTTSYLAGDASLLYRFYDSRDNKRNAIFGTSLYGRFGFGFIKRDADLALESDTPVYFGAGAGIETYFTRNFGARLEVMYHDIDAASAKLALVGRFGGRKSSLSPPRAPNTAITNSSRAPSTQNTAAQKNTANNTGANTTLPETIDLSKPETFPQVELYTETPAAENTPATVKHSDADKDGVLDNADQCPDSILGYPVGPTGCSALSHLASKLYFNNGSTTLEPGGRNALRQLTALLKQYSNTRIELIAHTDNSVPEPSNLTRGRLRTLGVHLVKNGIEQQRLTLRSFGAKRPIFDNSTVSGRLMNNRIEIVEKP